MILIIFLKDDTSYHVQTEVWYWSAHKLSWQWECVNHYTF